MLNLPPLITAVATPFRSDNSIDTEAFSRHLAFLHDEGCRCLLVTGTTGEFFSLLPDERQTLLELALEHFPGTVLFHTGEAALETTVREARRAQETGAHGIVALPPFYYANLTPAGVTRWFQVLAASIQIPLILYNFPFHTQVSLTPDILDAVPHFALKDSSRTLELIPHTPRYFVGGDPWITRVCERGGQGFVSAASNAFPALYASMAKAFQANDNTALDPLQKRIDRICEVISGPTLIARTKYAISRRVAGYPYGVRDPLAFIEDADRTAIDSLLTELDRE
jgi:4-hydroxy-tetrahydrodipicolinate synthase